MSFRVGMVMGKIPWDEKWRYCDRCYFRYPMSQLRKDPKSGHWFCVSKVHCTDQPNVHDLNKSGEKKGFVFR